MSGPSDPRVGDVDPRIGTLLADRYRIDALVGEGGMGKVYSAEHVLMRKRLAVKVLHRELTSVPEVVARFEREAMAAANIEHPNVAAATDFGKLPDGAVFLVLEFVSGRSLRDEVAQGPFAVDRALHVARQIAAALGAAHLQGIVHRDLKPENVMLVEKGGDPDFVKVLDFGIAKVPLGDLPGHTKQGNPITKAGMVFGTPEYMAPEQALGQNVDGRADLYALGVILFEMLSGVRPFSSQSSVGILGQQLSKPPPTFLERAPGIAVPPSVEQITHKLLQRESGERFASATDLLQVIDALLAPLPGRGVYRYTLADGSPPSVRGSNPSHPAIEAPLSFDFGQPPILPPLPGSVSSPELSEMRFSATGVAGQKFGELVQGFERSRKGWPAPVRNAVRHVPTRALLIAGAVVSLVLTVVGISLCVALVHALRGKAPAPSSSSTSSASSGSSASAAPVVSVATQVASASEAEMQDAVKAGMPALEALSAKYPNDPHPVLELARAAVGAREYVRAVGFVGRALNLDPTQSDSKQVASILFQTAQVKPASDASFALLFGPMGSHGPDIAYDLAATEVVKPWVRARADQWLRSPDFDRLSTPELNIAVALRFTTNCPQRYALLLRAKNVGDERALGYLNQYKA
ncbi:MAG TPA: serine/threonine-protein kinase, partial [Polyangiaceae bacterium]|nr:serine/threonine-protein kinase [Polyangiaceae bacterium]